MIAFLSPLWLLAGLAAAVPLAIHLLRRRTGARVEFPAARWLARAEREHSRALRLRNLLLMLMRMGALLLLAIAAARPVARIGGAGHAPTALAIVLDNSLSTSAVVDGHPVLDDLKKRALAVAGRATGDDRLWLLTADGAVAGGSAGAVRDAIAHITPIGGAGDVAGAVERAAALAIASPLGAREVAVLTDGQATTWRRPLALGAVHVAIYRPAAAPPRDHAVVMAAAEPERWTPRGVVHARVRATDSVTYRITLGPRTLARGTAEPGGELFVRAAPPERGWLAGAVTLEPDELRGDDTRHVALWVGAPPLVHVDPSAGLFASTAVAALLRAGRVAQGSSIAVASADAATALPALLVAPSDPVRLGAANRTLERLGVPWRLGAPLRGTSSVRGMPGVTTALRYALLRAAGGATAETLAVAGGEPWIVHGPRYVLVASPLLPSATTLPLRASFVPWMADMLSQQLGADGRALTAAPLERVARPAGIEALESPDGARLALEGDSLTAPGIPGVYWLLRAGVRHGALVVDPEPAESELSRLDPPALAALVHAASVVVVDDSARFATAGFTSAPRRPIAAWLLALAAALLVAEGLLAASGSRAEPL